MGILDLNNLAEIVNQEKLNFLQENEISDIGIVVHETTDRDLRLGTNQIVVTENGNYLVSDNLMLQDSIIHMAFEENEVTTIQILAMAKAIAIIADILDIEISEEYIDVPIAFGNILESATWYLDNGFYDEE